MAGETTAGLSHVLEWTIENFTCWNLGIREMILSPTLHYFWGRQRMYLYPKGPDGNGEHLEMFFLEISRGFDGVVSYIASDGSLICSQRVRIDRTKEDRNVKFPTGPKYEDVVARIKGKDNLYNDTLTLRFEERSNCDREYRVVTEISANDTWVRVPNTAFDLNPKTSALVSVMVHPMDDGKEEEFTLWTSQQAGSKIELFLQPRNFPKNIAVRTCMMQSGGSRTEEKEHRFSSNDKWTFSDSLTKEQVSKEGFSILLRVRIVPRKKYNNRSGCYSYLPKDIEVMSKQLISGEDSSNNSLRAMLSDQSENPVKVLAQELMCLYQDQDFSDFQLKCGDVTFPVHKAILSARSPVFRGLLSSDMREVSSGAVDIEDLDPSTLSRFLCFLYTGAVDDLQCDAALKLYYAADKYQVPTLRNRCAAVLREGVCVSNVCDVLSLADRHQDEGLTSVARDFILENFQLVLTSEEWRSFMKSDGDLLLRTLTYFAQKNYVGRVGGSE